MQDGQDQEQELIIAHCFILNILSILLISFLSSVWL